MCLYLIEFSAVVSACGYKSRLSIRRDSQKMTSATDAGEGAAGVQEEDKIYVCKEKHDPGSLLPVSRTSFPLP